MSLKEYDINIIPFYALIMQFKILAFIERFIILGNLGIQTFLRPPRAFLYLTSFSRPI